MLLRTGPDLSKRPSNNSLIHFYKRCVSMALNSQLTSLIYSGSMKVLLIREKPKNRKAVGCGMVFSSLVYKRYVSVRLGTLSQSFIQDQRRSTKHKLKKYFKMSHRLAFKDWLSGRGVTCWCCFFSLT